MIETSREARARLIAEKAAEQRFRAYVPYLTEKEREILSYLLHHKQKVFTADADMGYANTLYGAGYLILAARGQVASSDVPVRVAEFVWRVMEESPQTFEYRGDEEDTSPWRVPWDAR
jgi:hypothetical protein